VADLFVQGECSPACAGRAQAIADGLFVWSDARRGWCVPSWAPKTPRESYYAVDVVFYTCPWCGRELPYPPSGEMAVTDGDDGC